MQLANRGYPGFNPTQVGHQACTAGWGFGPAARPYWLLHYVHHGKGFLRLNGAIHTVGKGDIFVIPAYAEAYYCADKQEPWEYSWIGFLAEEIPEDALSQSVIHCPTAGRIFNDMCRCGHMGNGKNAYLCSRIWELLAMIIDGRDDSTPSDHITKAISYMHAQYDQGITVTDVVNHINLERTYFASLFKKRMGTSPITYLTTLRLNQAAQLIRHYGKSPTVAALSVGYGDYSHFSKAFKQRFGCSPRQYQKTTE